MKLLNYVTLPIMTVVCSVSSLSTALAADDLPDWARGLDAATQADIRANMHLPVENLGVVLELQKEDRRANVRANAAAEEATREFLAREAAEEATREFLAREAAEEATREFLAREAMGAAEAAEAATLALLAEEERLAAADRVAKNAAAQEKKDADAAAEALARNLFAQEKEAAAAAHKPNDEEVRQGAMLLKNDEKIKGYIKDHNKTSPGNLIDLNYTQSIDDPKTRAFLTGVLAIEMGLSDKKATYIIDEIFGELDEEEEKDNG
ncbi:MAG: hypothetical protein K0R76_1255 [Alphaproteobacteria bacterium]|nr:hypothetical protein [Alphaproteobacteria bacterium]